jgi:hypothetical protein
VPCCLKRHAKLIICRLFGGVFLTLAVCAAAIAADVTLAWDPVAASDIAGYNLHYGTASRQYSGVIDAGKTTSCKVPNLTAGKTWYFAATAYTTSGKQSGYSNEVVYTVPAAATATTTTAPTTSTGTTATAPKTLAAITISGPDTVNENSSAAYTCTATYSDGSSAAVTPTWSENSVYTTISTAGKLTATAVAADQSVTLTASFQGRSATRTVVVRNVDGYRLTIQKSGSGNVAASPSATTYSYGTTVKLFAYPYAGWVFDGWAGMTASAESPATTIVMNRDHSIIANFTPDTDRDSIADTIESGRYGNNPNYDGNADGVPDRLRAQVATLFSYSPGYYTTLSSATPVKFAYCKGVVPPRQDALPNKTILPMGTFNMQLRDVPAASRRATVSLSLPDSVPYVNSWYAYGPTPDNTEPHWYKFMYDRSTGTGAVIAGRKVTLYYKDGARGDDDLTPNGRILSRGGPATKK